MPDEIERLVGDDEAQQIDDETAFQREYDNDHSWEDLQEDAYGNLVSLDNKEEQRAKRKRLMTAAASARIKRGMIRYVQLIVDYSAAAGISDMRPTRAITVARILQTFVREFFDQNPLSHIGIIAMRNGRAEALTDLSGSPESHGNKLKANLQPAGDASLQNALQLALDALATIPPYGNREIVIVFSAMSTCDPGNIQDTIKAAKEAGCRVSIIGLAAEVYVCRQIVEATGGTYGVARDEAHLTELILQHSPPPPLRAAESAAQLVRMGFPVQNPEGPNGMAFLGPDCQPRAGGFTCPRCMARVVDIPSSCHICKLTLVSSSHLARSYHHLFPVRPFTEVQPRDLQNPNLYKGSGQLQASNPGANGPGIMPAEEWRETEADVYCFGCLQPIVGLNGADIEDPGVIAKCPDCHRVFCFECDTYIHESLHNCPGCECIGTDDLGED